MGQLRIPVSFIQLRRLALDVVLGATAFCVATIVPMIGAFGLQPLFRTAYVVVDVVGYMVAAAVAFTICGTYRMVWRYVSFRDLFNLMRAVALTVALFYGGVAIWFYVLGPRVAIPGILIVWGVALLWASTLAFVAAPRLIARMVAEKHRRANKLWPSHRRQSSPSDDGRPLSVLLCGSPHRMDTFIRECSQQAERLYEVAGVFTEDARLHGSYLNGVKVFGPAASIPEVLRKLGGRDRKPDYLVLADDGAGQDDLERLLDLVVGTDIQVGRLPSLNAFQGEWPIRPIALSDLLGRPEIARDAEAVSALVSGRCVMVTGAGGSIGGELCRQVSQLEPSKIVLLDYGEFNLYSIDRELHETFPDIERVTALVDVRDTALVDHWVKTMRPELVFHAAALKHVPLVEAHPIEAVKTNVVGTSNVANACRTNGVKVMVTISTDKAVNPHNVMGATKRLAEAYCQGLDQAAQIESETRFVTVRFGNVLGSAGSVVPLFQHQIECGGPVTVTHPDIKRYFMTIPEAVTLVLQAGAHGAGQQSERASIYVLDMGEPVKIIDLAAQMIRLSGRRPGADIEIKIIGLRPGEKLFEEVVHSDEAVEETSKKSVLKVTPRFTDLRILRQQIQELVTACTSGDRDRALRVLKLAVPEYTLGPEDWGNGQEQPSASKVD